MDLCPRRRGQRRRPTNAEQAHDRPASSPATWRQQHLEQQTVRPVVSCPRPRETSGCPGGSPACCPGPVLRDGQLHGESESPRIRWTMASPMLSSCSRRRHESAGLCGHRNSACRSSTVWRCLVVRVAGRPLRWGLAHGSKEPGPAVSVHRQLRMTAVRFNSNSHVYDGGRRSTLARRWLLEIPSPASSYDHQARDRPVDMTPVSDSGASSVLGHVRAGPYLVGD